MSETCGQEAKTVHRLLETTFNDRGEQRFARDRENPLPYRAVIVDEMSMVDSLLFASLLDALKPEAVFIELASRPCCDSERLLLSPALPARTSPAAAAQYIYDEIRPHLFPAADG